MNHRLFDGGSILLVVVIIAGAILAAGGLKTSEQRCEATRAGYADWVARGKPGGAEEEKWAGAFYRLHKALCAARGIEI